MFFYYNLVLVVLLVNYDLWFCLPLLFILNTAGHFILCHIQLYTYLYFYSGSYINY